jgi:hypothetical protein
MPFATSAPISANNLSNRYVDAVSQLPPATSVPLGTRIWVEGEKSFYVAQPSAIAPHAASWMPDGPGLIGISNGISAILGGLRLPLRQIANVDYTVKNDDVIVEYDVALTADRTLTIPFPNPVAPGRVLILKLSGAPGAFKVNLSATVDGVSSALTVQYQVIRIYDSGLQWLSW